MGMKVQSKRTSLFTGDLTDKAGNVCGVLIGMQGLGCRVRFGPFSRVVDMETSLLYQADNIDKLEALIAALTESHQRLAEYQKRSFEAVPVVVVEYGGDDDWDSVTGTDDAPVADWDSVTAPDPETVTCDAETVLPDPDTEPDPA